MKALILPLLFLFPPALAHSPVDPLTVTVDTTDADRFAALFKATKGQPTASEIQAGYLDHAGRGVAIFTPGRIKDAARMEASVAKRNADYAYAIDHCLTLARDMTPDLRAIYLAYAGLMPERPLPAIHIVFGGGNSGGTAAPDAQVIGLEVMCKPGTTRQAFVRAMRAIFAHETAHTWQKTEGLESQRNMLLVYALVEGTADYLAALVTGSDPTPAREAWGRPREAAVWREFQKDAEILKRRTSDDIDKQPDVKAALRRWFENADSGTAERPGEAGYWVGMQIAKAYVDRATDKRAAIAELLDPRDAEAILSKSGYGGGW